MRRNMDRKETTMKHYRLPVEELPFLRGHGLASIAFPAISTGIYGYPLDRATEVAVALRSPSLWT